MAEVLKDGTIEFATILTNKKFKQIAQNSIKHMAETIRLP